MFLHAHFIQYISHKDLRLNQFLHFGQFKIIYFILKEKMLFSWTYYAQATYPEIIYMLSPQSC